MPTKGEIVTAIMQSMPYANQITDLDFESENDGVLFTWRKSKRFKISTTECMTWEVGDGVLSGGDMCILIEKIVKDQWLKNYMEKPEQ